MRVAPVSGGAAPRSTAQLFRPARGRMGSSAVSGGDDGRGDRSSSGGSSGSCGVEGSIGEVVGENERLSAQTSFSRR